MLTLSKAMSLLLDQPILETRMSPCVTSDLLLRLKSKETITESTTIRINRALCIILKKDYLTTWLMNQACRILVELVLMHLLYAAVLNRLTNAMSKEWKTIWEAQEEWVVAVLCLIVLLVKSLWVDLVSNKPPLSIIIMFLSLLLRRKRLNVTVKQLEMESPKELKITMEVTFAVLKTKTNWDILITTTKEGQLMDLNRDSLTMLSLRLRTVLRSSRTWRETLTIIVFLTKSLKCSTSLFLKQEETMDLKEMD